MNPTTRNIGIGVAIVIILVLIGWLIWRAGNTSSLPAATSTATSTAATSTATSTGVIVNVSGNGTSTSGYTVTEITPPGGSAAPAAPDYKTPLTFSSDISAEDQSQDEASFAQVQSTLATDPTDYGSWIELGLLRQATGDYAGAAADWKYVTEIYPSDPTAFNNLGFLYWNYFKEPAQAIVYYKDAIKLDPTQAE